jgi:hypothetical protein
MALSLVQRMVGALEQRMVVGQHMVLAQHILAVVVVVDTVVSNID